MADILARWLGRQAMLAEVEAMVAKATRDANGTLPDSHPSIQATPGEHRGIPIQAKGIGGASPGTRPGDGLDDWGGDPHTPPRD